MEIINLDARSVHDFRDFAQFVSTMKTVRPLRMKFAVYGNVAKRKTLGGDLKWFIPNDHFFYCDSFFEIVSMSGF